MEKNWADLTSDERRQKRFKQWLSPEIQFSSQDVAKAYRERVNRLIRCIQLKVPDRVPCMLPTGFFPVHYAGITLETAIYDYAELRKAWLKFIHEFDMDLYAGPSTVLPGRVLEGLGFKQYRWPGYGLDSAVSSYQYLEGEYMKADEYDALINDPSDFWMRVHLPRIFSALEPFQKLPSFTTITEIPSSYLTPYARPDVQTALRALLRAGAEMAKWLQAVQDCDREALQAGFPSLRGGMVKAPFDILGDTLRGTRGIIMDMYRQPGKLLEALERMTPLVIEAAISAANASGAHSVFMPLHKGDDAFMSDKQFTTFYWPTLKKVILGLIEDGIVPLLFAEGSYNNRLEIIKELPRGAVIWQFDQTDMAKAKKSLDGCACIAGNVPTSLVFTGTARAVKEYCRKLIESCGQGGGFILAGGANLEKGKAENLRAMMEAAKEYGEYK
jgi:uroporphyrinogen-III decarboxylase